MWLMLIYVAELRSHVEIHPNSKKRYIYCIYCIYRSGQIICWAFEADSISMHIPLWIDNRAITASKTYDVKSATDGTTIHTVSAVDEETLHHAIRSAHVAFQKWRNSTRETRQQIFSKAADLLESRAQDYIQVMHGET